MKEIKRVNREVQGKSAAEHGIREEMRDSVEKLTGTIALKAYVRKRGTRKTYGIDSVT